MSIIQGAFSSLRSMCRRQVRVNVDEGRGLIFVHNPKCAGTSLRESLGLDTRTADHRYPASYVSKKEWEKYYSISVIREPLERLLSSFRFHCRSNYNGVYLDKYPHLKTLTFEQYLILVESSRIVGMGPQRLFTEHAHSDKRADCILFFEDLKLELIPKRFFVSELRELNSARLRKVDREEIVMTQSVYMCALNHLRTDYNDFGDRYKVPSHEDLSQHNVRVVS